MATWTTMSFTANEVLGSTKLQNLDNNLDALAEGASGAPKIQYTAIASAAMNDAKFVSREVMGFHFKSMAGPYVHSLAAGASWYPSAGAYMLGPEAIKEVKDVDGYWLDADVDWGFFICDGTDVRVRNTGASAVGVSYYHFNY